MIVLAKSRILHVFTSNISKFHTTVKNYKNLEIIQRSDLLKINQNSVIISQSRDIYENLALEDWLYKNYDFTSNGICILLLWYNGPSVVIGRHQNPWIECSVDFCRASGINIARRNSGGGTVYHDYGNLNLSFLTPRNKYNRKNNLSLISNTITNEFQVKLNISQRDDILYDEKFKVSGTASKLGKSNAYHHCTILVNVDEIKLKQALHRELNCVQSKATSSVKAKVINLQTVCQDINIMEVMKSVIDAYKHVYEVENTLSIYPCEDLCPGMNDVQEHLKSWEWCFGHTPRFSVTKTFPICSSFSKWKGQNLPPGVKIMLSSNKGKIESIDLSPQILDSETIERLSQSIIGFKFSDKIFDPLETWVMHSKNKILCKFVMCCILQMILDVYR